MSSSRLLDKISCPLCSSDSTEVVRQCFDKIASKTHFSIRRCKSCSMEFTAPLPREEDMLDYYKSDSYAPTKKKPQGSLHTIARLVQRFYTHPQRRRLLQKYCKVETPHMLDLGCGIGSFMEHMIQAGWTAKGVEPEENALSLCIDKGLDVESLDALHSMPNDSYDVIVLWCVLEHVYDLDETMQTIQKLLKKDGICLISVPNGGALSASWYGETWHGYDVPRHLYHFRFCTLRKLAAKYNLQCIDERTDRLTTFYLNLRTDPNLVRALFRGLLEWMATFFSVRYGSLIVMTFQKTH